MKCQDLQFFFVICDVNEDFLDSHVLVGEKNQFQDVKLGSEVVFFFFNSWIIISD